MRAFSNMFSNRLDDQNIQVITLEIDKNSEL